MSYYGKRYSSQVTTRIARILENYGMRGEWRELMKIAEQIEATVRRIEQNRYEDWRD